MRSLFFFLGTVTAATLFRRGSLLESVSRAVTKGFGPLLGGSTTTAPEQTATVQIPELTAVVNVPGPTTAATLQTGQVRPGDAVVKVGNSSGRDGNNSSSNANATAKTKSPVMAGVAKPSDQLTRIVPSV